MFLPSKASLVVGGVLLLALAVMGWQLTAQIKANGALSARLDAAAIQAQGAVATAKGAADDWQALYRAEVAAREQAQELAAHQAKERQRAAQAAAKSAAELEKYLRSVRDDPTACVNHHIPAAVHQRLLDASASAGGR